MDALRSRNLTLQILVILLGLLAAAGVRPSIVYGQEGANEGVTADEVNDVASQLFCPTCEGVPVDVCPTQVCSDWRSEIRTQLASGRSEREILDYFADRYGEGVLSDPPPRGIGLFVWIAPFFVVIGGVVIFWLYLQQLRREGERSGPLPAQATGNSSSGEKPTAADGYRSRLEDELSEDR